MLTLISNSWVDFYTLKKQSIIPTDEQHSLKNAVVVLHSKQHYPSLHVLSWMLRLTEHFGREV